MPDADVRKEVWIGNKSRVDIAIGDSKARIERGILVEMKANLSTSEANRLLGQTWTYLGLWRGKGPLVLVLCRTGAEYAGPIRAFVDEMRNGGHAVVALLAAPKGRQ